MIHDSGPAVIRSVPRRLLNHFVGPHDERRRDTETECFGGPQVDDEPILPRLFDRQIRRFRPFENFVHVGGSVSARIAEARTVGDQARPSTYSGVGTNVGTLCRIASSWIRFRWRNVSGSPTTNTASSPRRLPAVIVVSMSSALRISSWRSSIFNVWAAAANWLRARRCVVERIGRVNQQPNARSVWNRLFD